MPFPDEIEKGGPRIGPPQVFAACFGILAIFWFVFLGVDTWDWFGIRRAGTMEEGGHGLIWLTIFTNGGPIEWIQWATLGAAGVVAAWVAGSLRERAGEEARLRFWLLMSVAFTIMLIEDSGEMRQQVWRVLDGHVGSDAVMQGAELVHFALIAAVPLFALWRYGGVVLRQRGVGVYVLAGFLCYAVAGGASATRAFGGDDASGTGIGWYGAAGEAIHRWIGGAMSHPTYEQELVYFLVIDGVLEESVELLGASCFLAASLMAAHYARILAIESRMRRLGEAA
jgi:hypothetical protein